MPIVLLDWCTSGDKTHLLSRIIVIGQGIYFFITFFSDSKRNTAYCSIISLLLQSVVIPFSWGRDVRANNHCTARSLRASHPNPYTVSVGKIRDWSDWRYVMILFMSIIESKEYVKNIWSSISDIPDQKFLERVVLIEIQMMTPYHVVMKHEDEW